MDVTSEYFGNEHGSMPAIHKLQKVHDDKSHPENPTNCLQAAERYKRL